MLDGNTLVKKGDLELGPPLATQTLDPQKSITPSVVAETIQQGAHFGIDAGGKLYMYRKGVYTPCGENEIGKLVMLCLENLGMLFKWSSHRMREVLAYIRTMAPKISDCPPLDQINLENGLLRLGTREFTPHTPDWLSSVRIPVSFNSNAECPEINSFIKSTLPADAVEVAYELAADLLTPDRSHQKAILLVGEGGNGKSTFLSLLTNYQQGPSPAERCSRPLSCQD